MTEVDHLTGGNIPEGLWQCARCGMVFGDAVHQCGMCEAQAQQEQAGGVPLPAGPQPRERPRSPKALKREFEREEKRARRALKKRDAEVAENEWRNELQTQAAIERAVDDDA